MTARMAAVVAEAEDAACWAGDVGKALCELFDREGATVRRSFRAQPSSVILIFRPNDSAESPRHSIIVELFRVRTTNVRIGFACDEVIRGWCVLATNGNDEPNHAANTVWAHMAQHWSLDARTWSHA